MLRRPKAGALLGPVRAHLDRVLVNHAAPRTLQRHSAAGLLKREAPNSLERDSALRHRRNSGTLNPVEPNSVQTGRGCGFSVHPVSAVWNMAVVCPRFALRSSAKRAEKHDGVSLHLWALVPRLYPGGY